MTNSDKIWGGRDVRGLKNDKKTTNRQFPNNTTTYNPFPKGLIALMLHKVPTYLHFRQVLFPVIYYMKYVIFPMPIQI